MRKVLSRRFFDRTTLIVAKDVLGKYLVRRIGDFERSSMIVEVEAYDGFMDKASHGSRGKTKRNEVMFGEAGHYYIYFTYGLHFMLNVVCGSLNFPAAILIRGTKDISGPGRITKYFKIGKSFNGLLIQRKSGLWIEDRGIQIKPSGIVRSKRIGVDYAGEWTDKPYRFRLSQQ